MFQVEVDYFYSLFATIFECFGFIFEAILGDFPTDITDMTCAEASNLNDEIYPYYICARYEYFQVRDEQMMAKCEELGHRPQSNVLASLKGIVSEVRKILFCFTGQIF